MSTLKLNAVAFNYGSKQILKDLSLTVEPGQLACLLGPSGCGKSTLLRLIAGFEQPLNGQIMIDNHCVASPDQMTAPQDRKVGMLFQNLALFPHLTVGENIAFGLHNENQESRHARTDELLQLCRLVEYKSHYPHQLSGGQRQRVALARAMAPKPNIILLDEPFSSVDSNLQSAMAQEVKHMLKADQSTALWVTHSLEEAFSVADQMGVMLQGRLLQWGSPKDLFDHPSHPDVFKFLNHANMVTGTLDAHKQLNTLIGDFDITNADDFSPGDELEIGVLKKDIQICHNGKSNAQVSQVIYQGGTYCITAQLEMGDTIDFFHEETVPVGKSICLAINNRKTYLAFKAHNRSTF